MFLTFLSRTLVHQPIYLRIQNRRYVFAASVRVWYCGNSRHDGLNAGEAGADYVSFGPVAETALGDGRHADKDLFAWWTEMIEVPVVAEGALDIARMRELAEVTDFIAIGPEIWTNEDPLLALRNLVAAMAGSRRPVTAFREPL